VIRGYLRLLEEQGQTLTDAHRNAVAAALRAGDRATEILGQVSTLARFESGEAMPTLQPAALRQLLESTVTALTLPARPTVNVQVGAAPEVSVLADEPLLRTALTGLTSAVIRARVADGPVFLLAREDRHEARPGVSVTITGLRFAEATEVNGPLDLSRGGLGLDLPLAAFIINAHHGHVGEHRRNGRFAGVVVWLPVA
jgi:signal transduction histidine kinase